jgi:uncharacterized membrane protein
MLDFGIMVGFLFWGSHVLAGNVDARGVRQACGTAALILLFVCLTLEVNSVLHQYVEGLRGGGVSIVWTLFAIGLLLGGIRRNIAPLRYAALALFAVVAWKVFFSDLERLDPIFRIVAFLVLGLLVLAGSFIYLKYRQSFAMEKSPKEKLP